MKDIAQALKFVRGAVAKKDFVPEFTFFRIRDRKVQAYNGQMSLCHPIDLDLDVAPKAKLFEAALNAVPEDTPVSITVTQAQRLSIKAGKFRVLVACHMNIADNFFPEPQGTRYEINLGLLEIFKDTLPFVAEDASRPWARAIKLTGNSAYATNNVVLVERWCPVAIPHEVVVPVDVVEQIVRMGVEPCAMQVSEGSVTFHFPNESWVRSQLFADPWPNVAAVIDQPMNGLQPVPENFYEDIKRLEKFITDNNTITLKGNVLSTTEAEGEGAHLEIPQALGDGKFHIKVLTKVASVATRVDFRNRPAVFAAKGLRGVAMPHGE